MRTYQHLDEWKFYQDSLKNRQYDRKDFWLDIPGNHDRFDILGFSKEIPFSTHIEALNGTDLTNLWNGYQDYYKLYSVQKSENFMYTFKSKHGDISVFSLDGW